MVQKLMQAIRSQQLGVGQRLPTLRELAQAHGVSYRIAHQAIAHLEAAGLVETLQGSGTYVMESKPAPASEAPLSNQVFIISNEIPQTYAACVHPIVQRLQAAGLLVIPLDYGKVGSRLPELMQIFAQWREQAPRGVIVKGYYPPVLDALASAVAPPTCLVMSYMPVSAQRRGWHMVTPEYESGYFLAARWLLEHGHRRIGLVTGPPTTPIKGGDRLRNMSVRGALRAYWEYGLQRGLKLHINPKTPADPAALGRDPANLRRLVRWMTRADGPTGFIATDHRAVCIKMAARQAGLTIGKDIDLVTYGHPAPALRGEHSCVVEAHDVIAEQIARIVLEHEPDAPSVLKHVIVPPRLVERRQPVDPDEALVEEVMAGQV